MTAEETGRPVRGARVEIDGAVSANIPDLSLSRTAYTDASGQFSFPRLPAGRFAISVYAEKYLTINYGQRRHSGRGRTIVLADGQQVTLQMSMQRGGVITGTVFSPDGEPVADVTVRALRQDMSSGIVSVADEGSAETDDRGIYRIYGLEPGEYLVAAMPGWHDGEGMVHDASAIERLIASGRVKPPAAPGLPPTVAVPVGSFRDSTFATMTDLPVYAPSALVPSGGTKLVVRAGDVKAGVDILLRLTQASRVSGSVLPVDPNVQVRLLLVSDNPAIEGQYTAPSQADGTGRFNFSNIPPGTYTLLAQATQGAARWTQVDGSLKMVTPEFTDAQKMWASVSVTASGQPEIDVSIALQPARSISGVVVFEAKKNTNLNRSDLWVRLSSTSSSSYVFPLPGAKVGADGRFTLTGVLPGRYKVWLSSHDLKSAVIGGQETLDFGLDFKGDGDITGAVLTRSDSVSELSGTLTDAAGKPASDVTIVVVASDARLCGPGSRRTFVTEPEADGRYTIIGLPAGAYLVAVVTDLEPGAQYDADFLRLIRSVGVPVTIADGAKVTQNLRVK